MKKIIFILSAILIGWLIAHVTYSAEREFDVTFVNESSRTIIYYVYQTNHGIEGFPFCINRAAGELSPYEENTITLERGCTFWVTWRGQMYDMIEAESTETVVLDRNMVFKYPILSK